MEMLDEYNALFDFKEGLGVLTGMKAKSFIEDSVWAIFF